MRTFSILRHASGAFALGTLVVLGGCGSRDDVWDQPRTGTEAFGLARSAVLVDPLGERALVVGATFDLGLETTSLPIGPGYVAGARTPDLTRVLALCKGDDIVQSVDDVGPSLAVIDDTSGTPTVSQVPLQNPLSGLVVDPQSRYAVLFQSPHDTAFVENPNELGIVDLQTSWSATNPFPLTLRSFGGQPQSFVFTETLNLPAGPTRLLAVLTDRDVGIIDLGDLGAGDVTLRLSESGVPPVPVQLVVTEGDKGRSDDTLIAVRLQGEDTVVLVRVLPVPKGQQADHAHQFKLVPNYVFVGGVPSDIAFVQTDGGQRLAALVPSATHMTLIDPETGLTSDVETDNAYAHMTLVTDVVGNAGGGDVALLYSRSTSDIAFVALGSTVGQPYRSVEHVSLDHPVGSVVDVPVPNDRLKLLTAAGGDEFTVLDLIDRTAAPINASQGATASIAPDGRRAWLTTRGASELADLEFSTLSPKNLLLGHPVARAFDVARREGGGRALLALHDDGAIGLTILDADHPALTNATEYGGLLLGGLP